MTELSIPYPKTSIEQVDPKIPVIDNQMKGEIQKIYGEFSEQKHLPHLVGGDCWLVAKRLSQELGLKYVDGFVECDPFITIEVNHYDSNLVPHFWVQDGKKTIVVLDGRQLNPYLKKAEDLFLSDGVEYVTVDDPRHKHFIPKKPLAIRLARNLVGLLKK